MCKCPIPIKNGYRKNKITVLTKNTKTGKKTVRTVIKDDAEFKKHDSHSACIYVPCGHCQDCVRARRYNLVQRCEMESLERYPYFITLTYNNEHLPKYICPDGKVIAYADRENVKKMFKRIRRHETIDRNWRYIAVSERGSKGNRPHHHILLFLEKRPEDDEWTPYIYEEMLYNLFRNEWRVNTSNDPFRPKYESLYTFKRKIKQGKINCTFDCHYVKPHIDDISRNVTQYIFKYITKPSKYEKILFRQLKASLKGKEFEHAWRTVRSCYCASRFWGTQSDEADKPDEKVLKHIKMCIEGYSNGFPQYYSPYSFDTCSLAPYYIQKKVFFSDEDFKKYNEYLHKIGYYMYEEDRTPTKGMKEYNLNNLVDELRKWEKTQELGDYDIINFEELT